MNTRNIIFAGTLVFWLFSCGAKQDAQEGEQGKEITEKEQMVLDSLYKSIDHARQDLMEETMKTTTAIDSLLKDI